MDKIICDSWKSQIESIDIAEPETKEISVAGSGLEIYNLLLAGEELRMIFPSKEKAANFRNYIATIKTRQDRINIAGELLSEDEVPTFTMWATDLPSGELEVVLSFVKPKKKKIYYYTILKKSSANS